jgi:phytoene desaturase
MLQYSKNDAIGGRARQLKKDGFTFDMGPSWYWMPDDVSLLILKKTTDYYELIKLSPAHRVYYGIDDFITINEDNLTEIIAACLKEAAAVLCSTKVIMILLLKI